MLVGSSHRAGDCKFLLDWLAWYSCNLGSVAILCCPTVLFVVGSSWYLALVDWAFLFFFFFVEMEEDLYDKQQDKLTDKVQEEQMTVGTKKKTYKRYPCKTRLITIVYMFIEKFTATVK